MKQNGKIYKKYPSTETEEKEEEQKFLYVAKKNNVLEYWIPVCSLPISLNLVSIPSNILCENWWKYKKGISNIEMDFIYKI